MKIVDRKEMNWLWFLSNRIFVDVLWWNYAVNFFFASCVNFLFYQFWLRWTWDRWFMFLIDFINILITFLDLYRYLLLSLNLLTVCLGDGGLFRPIRRRKDAERDRNAGVKVQIDELLVRELFSNAFRRAERKTRRGLLLLSEGEN